MKKNDNRLGCDPFRSYPPVSTPRWVRLALWMLIVVLLIVLLVAGLER